MDAHLQERASVGRVGRKRISHRDHRVHRGSEARRRDFSHPVLPVYPVEILLLRVPLYSVISVHSV